MKSIFGQRKWHSKFAGGLTTPSSVSNRMALFFGVTRDMNDGFIILIYKTEKKKFTHVCCP